jgi:hypothetical protein
VTRNHANIINKRSSNNAKPEEKIRPASTEQSKEDPCIGVKTAILRFVQLIVPNEIRH